MIKAISILITIFLTCTVFSQNTTYTLATNGLFYIKGASNTFFSLKQSNGFLGLGTTSPNDQLEITKNFRMPYTTSSSVGVIYKGSDRFIHNFAPAGALGGNTFLGLFSGNFTMTASQSNYSSFNTAVGHATLEFNSTGYNNTAIGAYGLYSNTTGYSNTAVGTSSLENNLTGSFNTSVGNASMVFNNTGNRCTGIGYDALYYNTSGADNTSMGSVSMLNNQTGSSNTVFGLGSLFSSTGGNYNTAIGISPLYSNTANYNVAAGYQAFYFNTTGYNNTGIGYYAGVSLTTGYDCTLLGYYSLPSSVTATNEFTLGDNNITALRCNVTSITSLSDMRDKKNITDLSLGLNFLCKLKPRQFNWDKREWYDSGVSDGSKLEKKLSAGFIAQELDSVQVQNSAEWLGLVYKENPDKLEATYGKLLPVIIKSVQELKYQNDELEKENDALRQQLEPMNVLKEKLSKLNKLVKELDSIKKDKNENNINDTKE